MIHLPKYYLFKSLRCTLWVTRDLFIGKGRLFFFFPGRKHVDKTYWISNEGWSLRRVETRRKTKTVKKLFCFQSVDRFDRYSSQPHSNPSFILKMLVKRAEPISLSSSTRLVVLIMWMANLFNASCCWSWTALLLIFICMKMYLALLCGP